MVGRKPMVNPTECVAAVMKFKERVVIENNGEKSEHKVTYFIF